VSRSRTAPRRLRFLPDLAVALAGALLVAGCATLPTTRYYLLELELELDGDPSPPAPPAAATTGERARDELRVAVAAAVVEPPYDQERIAYRPPGAAQEVAFYHYHRWSASPSRLAQSALAAALDRVEGIAAEPERAGVAYDLVLQPTVLRWVEIDSPGGIEVALELRWGAAGPDGAVLGSGAVDVAEPVTSTVVDAVVAAFARAFASAGATIGDELLDLR
jgi:ABC-type uncharacterized transport system auxiliary subunit